MQVFISLIRTHLFLLLFPLLWETELRKYCCNSCQNCSRLQWLQHTGSAVAENVLPIFSPRSPMMSCLIFNSLSHFEFFLCVYDVRECSNFIDLHEAAQLSQQHLLKRLSFLQCIFLPH